MRAPLFPFHGIVGVALLVIPLFPAPAQPAKVDQSGMMIHDIPKEEATSLREAGDSFMRQFSGSTSFGEYQAAFESLLRRDDDDMERTASKAHELAAISRAGLTSADSDIGPPVLGKFTFAGSRKVGPALLKLAYWRHHRLGPMPLVLAFTKPEEKWGLSQVGFGGDLAGPDLEACWVYEKPVQLARRIPAFPEITASIGECMDSLVKGKPRTAFETLVKKWSGDAPDPTILSEALITGLENARDLGPVTGYKFIGTSRQSDMLCRLVLTLRFGKKHAPVSFRFYRPGETWLLWKVSMFDEATRDLTDQTVTTQAD